ncbi:MAG: porin [Desulfobulbaceae bacterium]|nr:porin [Desulfobulbaceae bacterium]
MKISKYLAVIAGLLASLVIAAPAWAGAELKIDDESSINLGFRAQVLAKFIESDLNGNGNFDSYNDFQVRRGRIRLFGKINEHISAFLQTELGSGSGGGGRDVRMIDAFVTINYNPWARIYAGINMAPSSRQTTTSSGGLMTMDRPGNNYKNLTWGTRSLRNFSTSTVSDTDGGLRGNVDVRDTGVTLFGSGSLSDTTHLKYYLGIYDGIQVSGNADRNLRMTGRVQLNLFDAEAGYYNLSTYLGKKKTLGFGISYDVQDAIQVADAGGFGDYAYYSVDAFTEWPMGAGTLTAEAAFSDLDLDGANANSLRSEGNGFYVQAGYLQGNWQPWFEYESWDSEATSGQGDYDAFRVGVSYFFKGHNANVKAGLETFNSDINFDDGDSNEDSSTAFILGFYITY